MTDPRVLLGAALFVTVIAAALWLATTKAVVAWAKPCDLSIPERPVLLRRTGALVAATTASSFVPGLAQGRVPIGAAAGVIVFAWLMRRWFDAGPGGVLAVWLFGGCGLVTLLRVVAGLVQQ